MKRCIDCGNTIPDDSKFCPFCGSSRIATVTQTAEPQSMPSQPVKTYKTGFIVALVICAILLVGIFALAGSESDSTAVVSSAGEENEKYEALMEIANQKVSPDFFTDKYVVVGKGQKIRIYYTLDGTVEWEWEYWGTSMDCNDFTEWDTDADGNLYFDVTVKISDNAYGIITFTNDASDETFKVFVTAVE